MPYENTVHGVVGTALEVICDTKLNNDLVIQHSNYSKQDRLVRRLSSYSMWSILTILNAASNKQDQRAEGLFGEKATPPMIDTRTRSIFPDIESFQCGSSLQGRSIGEVQNSVLVQENVDHLHILGISHTIHL